MDLFKLKEHNTSVKQELSAGLTTFLAMVYIVPLNAIIMSKAGMPMDALVTATALFTLIATIGNGLWANTPMGLSVGMGLNAYFTFGLCMGQKMPWQTALGIVFISAAIFTALSFTNFRIWIIRSIPLDLRRAISAGIGAFICLIGLKEMGVIVDHPATLVSLGHLADPKVLIGILGIILTVGCFVMNIPAAFIVAISITSVIAWVTGVYDMPTGIVSMPASISPIFGQLDIAAALNIAFLPFIITFFVTHLFDSIGTLTGVGNRAGIFKEDEESMKKLARSLNADASASMMGAIGGTSTITVFAESASGVEAGGKTGLTGVFTGLFFILTLFLLPLFKAIPANAIYPILVMVGVLMFSELGELNYKDPAIMIAAFFTVIMMPLTYSITNGLSCGFVFYIIVRLFQRKFEDINSGVITLAVISLLALISTSSPELLNFGS